MEDLDPIDDLRQKYKPLRGMEFEATYEGDRIMPQTENSRDVLSIEKEDPFAETLREISDAVLEAYGKKIWKGITGPPDFADYWLWVEPVDELTEDQEGCSRNFRVKKCTPFQCNGNQFSHGVSIKVSVIQPAWSIYMHIGRF